MDNNITRQAYDQNSQQGLAVIKEFMEVETQKPMELTTDLLLKLLRDNKDTEYGRRYDFANIHSVEDYRRKIPVVVYDDLAPYLERMMAGEKNLLTAYKYDHFNETSGTVGIPKLGSQRRIHIELSGSGAV